MITNDPHQVNVMTKGQNSGPSSYISDVRCSPWEETSLINSLLTKNIFNFYDKINKVTSMNETIRPFLARYFGFFVSTEQAFLLNNTSSW